MVGIRILAIRLLFISLAALIRPSEAETEFVKQSLVNFMKSLSGPNFPTQIETLGWDVATDPCHRNQWRGVFCDESGSVISVSLSGYRFKGALDAKSLCSVESLVILRLINNTIPGPVPEEIGECTNLSILKLNNNRFIGSIPDGIGSLTNLTVLDLSNNRFSGPIPDSLGELPTLLMLYLENNRLSGSIPESIASSTNRAGGHPLGFFRAQNNRLSGPIPRFDFETLVKFNVSNNDLSGPIPDQAGIIGFFGADCFMGNPGLCGEPLSNSCPAPPPVQSPATSGSPGRKGLTVVMIMVSCSLGISLVSFLLPFV